MTAEFTSGKIAKKKLKAFICRLCLVSTNIADFLFLPVGRSYCVCTQRMLLQCLESLVQKVQSGVVLNFEKTGPDPAPVGDGKLYPSVH